MAPARLHMTGVWSMTPCQRRHFNQKIKGTRQRGKQRGRSQNGGPGSSVTNQPPHQQSRKMPSALAAVKAPMAPPNPGYSENIQELKTLNPLNGITV